MADSAEEHSRPLGPGQTVYTRDGRRLGKIEMVGRDAFKLASVPREPAFWILRDAVERTTYGGLVFLSAADAELDAWRWTPPPNALTEGAVA